MSAVLRPVLREVHPRVGIRANVNTVPIHREQSERGDASAFRMSPP